MQIWKPCLCSCKNNTLKISHSQSEKFSSYLLVKFVNSLKSRLIFNIFCCFWVFVTNSSHISRVHISKIKSCFNLKFSTYYFHMKTKILSDFQICISASLSSLHCVESFQIRTEYGEIQSISPYSVRMRENTDQK